MGMVQPVDEGGRIAVRSVGGSLILELRGQFDLRNAHDLRRVLEVAAERYDRLVLDVTQTTFMDSSGVNALMHGRRAGLEITIRGNSPARRTIELLDLGTVFELED
jgi:anti-anti-sigma factor